jgi:hypothetical protein
LSIASQAIGEDYGDYTITLTLEAVDDGRSASVSFTLSIPGGEEEAQEEETQEEEEVEEVIDVPSEYIIEIEETEESEEEVLEDIVEPELPAPKVKQTMSNTGELKLEFD